MKYSLSDFDKRELAIKNLGKIPVLDKDYLEFLSCYKTAMINEDMEIFGYEKALNNNKYIEENFKSVADFLWFIGRSGQGDEWFLDLNNELVLFYDHDQGEYPEGNFTKMNINFSQLIHIGLIIKEVSEYLDTDTLNESLRNEYINQINAVAVGFQDRYPYKLW